MHTAYYAPAFPNISDLLDACIIFRICYGTLIVLINPIVTQLALALRPHLVPSLHPVRSPHPVLSLRSYSACARLRA